MKLCTCNNCNWIYEDKNPQVGAKEYPDDIQVQSLEYMRDIEDLEWCWACPVCQTDGFLVDKVDEDKLNKYERI